MVIGSPAHWPSPQYAQALPRASAPSLLAHKHAVTLLAPTHEVAAGANGSAPAAPLGKLAQQGLATSPDTWQPQLGSCTVCLALDPTSGGAAAGGGLSHGAPLASDRDFAAGVSSRGCSTGSPSSHPGFGTRPAPEPAALTSWIKSSRNIARLLRLVRQYGDQMNHIHISAVVTHLSQLATEDDATAAALLAAAAPPAASPHRTDACASSNVLPPGRDLCADLHDGVSARDGGSTSTSAAASAGALSGPAAGAPPPQRSTSAPSSSNGGGSGSSGADGARELLASVLALLHDQLPYFEPRQLANTAWALGKWPAGVAGRDGALSAVLQASAPLLPHYRPQELTNLLYGWASCVASSSSSAATSPSAAASCFSSSATSSPGAPPAAFPAATAATSAAGGGAQWQPLAFLAAHSRACLPQLRTGRFKMQELSNLLWAWGVLLGGGGGGSRNAASATLPAGWAGGQVAPSAAAAGLATVVPYRELLGAQLQLGLSSAGPQELANSTLSLARLQLLPPSEWFNKLLLACRKHLLASATAAVVNGNVSTAATGSQSPPPTRGSAPPGQSVKGPHRAPPPPPPAPVRTGFSPQELSNLLWGCSKLHLRLPPRFLDDIAPALECCLPYMSLHERVNVLWALAWQAKLGAVGGGADGEWAPWDVPPGPPKGEEEEGFAAAESWNQDRADRDGPLCSRAGVVPFGTAGGQRAGAAGLDRGEAADSSCGFLGGAGSTDRGGAAGVPEAGLRSCSEAAAEVAARDCDVGRAAGGGPQAVSADAAAAGSGAGVGVTAAQLPAEPRHGVRLPGTAAAPPPNPSPPSLATSAATAAQKSSGLDQRQPQPLGAADPDPLQRPYPHSRPHTRTRECPPGQHHASHHHHPAQPYPHPDAAAVPGRAAASQHTGPAAAAAAAVAAAAVGAADGAGMSRATDPTEDTSSAAPKPPTRASLVRYVVRAVLEALLRSPESAAPQDVSVALWSTATLASARAGGDSFYIIPATVGDGGCCDGGGKGAAEGASIAPDAADGFVRLWGRCLEGMSPQGQANCVWAAARLRLRLPSELQGRLAAWLRRNAPQLSPAESAAVLRGLGRLAAQGGLVPPLTLAPPPQPVASELGHAVLALLDQAYVRHSRYEPWELAQVCHGGAMMLRWLGRAAVNTGGNGAEQMPLPPEDRHHHHHHLLQRRLPAAAAVRMSGTDLDAAWGSGGTEWAAAGGGGAGTSPVVATATAAAAAVAQQRRLAAPLDALLTRLQQAYCRAEPAARRGAADALGPQAAAAADVDTAAWVGPRALGLEELVMTLEAVAAMLPEHVSPNRGSELSTWCQDLVRSHARRALAQAPHHVHALAPLLRAFAAAAVSSVRAARARKLAAMERVRGSGGSGVTGGGAGSGGAPARSSMDEFTRSGRLAARREELQRLRRAQERQQEDLQAASDQQQHRQQWQQRKHAQQRDPAEQSCEVGGERTARAFGQPPAAEQVEEGGEASEPRLVSRPPSRPQPRLAAVSTPPGPLPQSAVWSASGLSLEWLQRFWAASAPSLHAAAPREAAMMLWALASLDVQPPDPWVKDLLAAVEPHLPRTHRSGSGGAAVAATGSGVSDQTLGVLLYSLGHLRVRPSEEWMAAALAAVDGWTTGGTGDARRGPRSSSTVDVDPAAVLGVLCGLALLEWPLPPDWLGRLVRAAAPQLARLRPAERTRAYAAVASLDAGLAERLGWEFSELQKGPGGPGNGRRGGAAAAADWEDAAQHRKLFSRARGGW